MEDRPIARPEADREQLLRQFSQAAVDRIVQPSNMRPLDKPHGYAHSEKDDGDRVELFIRLDGDRIVECTFTAQACAASVACLQAVTELAAGRSLQQALLAATTESVLELLGGLPPGNVHCAHAAVSLFRSALSDALQMRKDSWKIVYRKFP